MKNVIKNLAFLSILLILTACDGLGKGDSLSEALQQEVAPIESYASEEISTETTLEGLPEEEPSEDSGISIEDSVQPDDTALAGLSISIDDIPAYSGIAYALINHNVPYFTDDELSTESYESYSELDSLGRCGVCMASIGQDIMPTEERGEIGSIKPSGWHTVKYPGIVDGNYLYNRCHLIGFQLTGENANIQNLITGTRYMNTEGMQPFENMVADYVKETGNHVMYRVTPLFEGDNLVAEGVLIEAESVEDNGKGILFNVFCYNVQPGISINYATGESEEDTGIGVEKESVTAAESTPSPEQVQEIPASTEPEPQIPADIPADSGAYAVNSKNGKIHIVGACPATGNGDNAIKRPVYFDTYEEAEAYSSKMAPSQNKRQCGNCW